jgi:hypothetical protein
MMQGCNFITVRVGGNAWLVSPSWGPSKEDKMSRSCSTHRREILNAHKFTVGKSEEKIADLDLKQENHFKTHPICVGEW